MASRTHDADLVVTGKVTQTGTPSASGDLVTKAYADSLAVGGTTALKMGGFALGTVISATPSDDMARVTAIVPGGWIRIDLEWATVQAGGSSSWSWYQDARVAAATAAGLKVMLVLGYAPSWANGGSGDSKVPHLEANIAAYQTFCYEAAKHYLPLGVSTYEIWNEANITTFWKPTPDVEAYVKRCLIPGANGVRQAGTELTKTTTVLPAGTAAATIGTATTRTITNKALTSGVATLTTSVAHGYTAGRVAEVTGVDSTFNGTYMIVSTPNSTTFTYNKLGATNVTSVASGGSVMSSTTGGVNLNIDPRLWYKGIYTYGGKNYMDALNVHTYTWPFPPTENSGMAAGSFSPNQWNPMMQVPDIRATMVTNGDSAKRIWNTEVGYPTRNAEPTYPAASHGGWESWADLPGLIPQVFSTWFSMGEYAGPLMWYQLRDKTIEASYAGNVENGFGIMDNGGTSKSTAVSVITTQFAAYANDPLKGTGGAAVAASSVTFNPVSTIAATNVQAAIEEMLAEAVGGGTPAASAVTFSPTGTIAATNVQAAIAEVASESAASGTKMSELPTILSDAIATNDKVLVLDISDTTMAASGSNKTAEIQELMKRVAPVVNASVSNQTGFATDTYLAGSSILIPSARLQAKSIYRCKFNVSKTGAGTVAPVIIVRFGTAGTTADTARATLTFPAQTAVIDEGFFDLTVVFRTVGSGTTAVIQATANLAHRLSVTGLSTGVSPTVTATSSGFDSTVASSIIGISVNGGTSAAWTVNSVIAEMSNLL